MKSFVIDAMRTPRGRGRAGKGALSGVHPQELLAGLLRALPDRAGVSLSDVDDVIIGAVSQSGEQGANIARNAVLAAGWPIEVGAASADHLARISERGIEALAASETTAMLLPGTIFFLDKPAHAPGRKLADHGAIVALATGCQLGSSDRYEPDQPDIRLAPTERPHQP